MMEELKARVRTLLRGEDLPDDLLTELLNLAEAQIRAETGRESLSEALRCAQVQLAVMHYNRLGTQGERSRHEGGMTLHWDDMPVGMLHLLRACRLGRLP